MNFPSVLNESNNWPTTSCKSSVAATLFNRYGLRVGPWIHRFSTSAQKVAEAPLNPFGTVNVRAEVDLADVVVLQDGGVSGVGSVVGSTMVQGAAGGEGQAGVQLVLLYRLTRTVLQPLAGRRNKMRRLAHCNSCYYSSSYFNLFWSYSSNLGGVDRKYVVAMESVSFFFYPLFVNILAN